MHADAQRIVDRRARACIDRAADADLLADCDLIEGDRVVAATQCRRSLRGDGCFAADLRVGGDGHCEGAGKASGAGRDVEGEQVVRDTSTLDTVPAGVEAGAAAGVATDAGLLGERGL